MAFKLMSARRSTLMIVSIFFKECFIWFSSFMVLTGLVFDCLLAVVPLWFKSLLKRMSTDLLALTGLRRPLRSNVSGMMGGSCFRRLLQSIPSNYYIRLISTNLFLVFKYISIYYNPKNLII